MNKYFVAKPIMYKFIIAKIKMVKLTMSKWIWLN
jgi:hypothetical protein